MYEEEDKNEDDDELEHITEESGDGASDESYDENNNRRTLDKQTREQKEIRLQQREEIKALKNHASKMREQLLQKANKIDQIKMELKQSSIAIQKGEEDSLNVQQQKSFIGGVPTDNIIEVLDEPEEVIAGRLKDIN